MKTETDKAIEFLKEGIKDGESLRELKSLDEREKNELDKSINKINDIIALLKQGEAYQRFREKYINCDMTYNGEVQGSVDESMEFYKQRYFPKEAKWV